MPGSHDFLFCAGEGDVQNMFNCSKVQTWLLFIVRTTLGFAPGGVQLFAEGSVLLKPNTELNSPKTALEDDCPMESRHCFEVNMECTSTELEPGLEAPTCLTTRRKRPNKPTRASLCRWRPPARWVCLEGTAIYGILWQSMHNDHIMIE